MQPVAEDGRIAGFEGFPVNPAFGRGTAYGIADQADGNLQAVPQHLAEGVADGREAGDGGVRGRHPARGGEVLQMVHGIQRRGGPSDVVRPPVAFHVIQTQARIGPRCRIRTLPDLELHVGLAGTQPDVAESNVAVHQRGLDCLDAENRARPCRMRRHFNAPATPIIGDRLIDSAIDRNLHRLPRIGLTPDGEGFLPGQDHVVGEHRRYLQAAVVARNPLIDRHGKDAGAFRIRMDGVREHPGITV